MLPYVDVIKIAHWRRESTACYNFTADRLVRSSLTVDGLQTSEARHVGRFKAISLEQPMNQANCREELCALSDQPNQQAPVLNHDDSNEQRKHSQGLGAPVVRG